MKIRALPSKVLATEIEVGERKTDSGIVLLDDNGKEQGIRPRWMQVYSKGNEVVGDYNEGDWILVEHGRWTRGMEIRTEEDTTLNLWSVDPDAILLVSEDRPVEFAKRY